MTVRVAPVYFWYLYLYLVSSVWQTADSLAGWRDHSCGWIVENGRAALPAYQFEVGLLQAALGDVKRPMGMVKNIKKTS